MQRWTRTSGLLPPVIVAGGLLAGCSSAPAEEPVGPASSPPTPTVEPAAAPQPRIDLACADALSFDELEDFIGAPDPLVPVPVPETVPPDRAASLQLGALVCEWDDGAVHPYWLTEPVYGSSIVLHVLPEGEAAAQEYVDLYAGGLPASPYGPTVQGPRCVGTSGGTGGERTGHCELMGWIADAWVEFRVDGIDVSAYATDDDLTAAFAGHADALLLAVDTAGGRTERWVASVSAPPIASCDDLGTAEQVGELSGLEEVWFGPFWDGPRVGQYVYAADATGALRCSIAFLDRDAGFGQLSVLPGGEWAFLASRDAWLAAGGSEIAVAGVEPGDAILRCDEGDECILDLRRQHDWIRVAFPPVPPDSVDYLPALDYAAARASAVPLAEVLLANAGG